MVSKNKSIFVCSECGYESVKWQGQCPDCGAWNTLVEENRIVAGNKKITKVYSSVEPEILANVEASEKSRVSTGIGEFDRVLGGGIVQGAAMLLCGEPGIGKSTLLLQFCGTVSHDMTILYISGEESSRQIKLRANRLGVLGNNIQITMSTKTLEIVETINTLKPKIVIIDSIQTLSLDTISSAPGSVSQVRESAQIIISACKQLDISLFIVGHVNKDGAIAGPKVLEHIVDAVLFFEGGNNLNYRIIRAVKNRFGSTNEIGVFDMSSEGLNPVANPSEMLLSGRPQNVSGNCVTCLMEGTRPILVEVQALATKTSLNYPRRVSDGFDMNRMLLLMAVLEKRGGYFVGNLDIYINVASGMKIDEPAADLSVLLSVVSNLIDKPLPMDLLALGEIGLAGEIRNVSCIQQRIGEGYSMGMRKFLIPESCKNGINASLFEGAHFIGIKTIRDAVDYIK